MKGKTMSNKIWGGRFSGKTDTLMQKLNSSIETDIRLYKQDIAGSLAHAAMLVQCGLLTKTEGTEIEKGLKQIKSEIENGTFTPQADLEDIHMNIEAALQEKIGDTAGKLHTARSRNDQVATDFRLYIRESIGDMEDGIKTLQTLLAKLASEHHATLMPGFTHLQNAQPISLGHYFLAYVEMLERDKSRLQDAKTRLNESPLGSCALAGTGFPIDRTLTAK
ncbi:MAG: lyase family protein, partial [Parvibaculales bacterium]